MSIGHHIRPVKNDSDSKLSEEHLYLKQLISAVDKHVENDNKHESLQQLLTLVRNKIVMHQTRYDGSLLLYMSTIILSTSNGIALNPVAQHQTPPTQVEHVTNQFNICVFSLTTKRMTTASHTRLI